MVKESRTHLGGRDSRNGRFTSIKKAQKYPDTHVVERIPKPGYGDTKKGK